MTIQQSILEKKRLVLRFGMQLAQGIFLKQIVYGIVDGCHFNAIL